MNANSFVGNFAETVGHRDAIHVAIISVEAGENLIPGFPCEVRADNKAYFSQNPVGVADPFLMEEILAGSKFYLMLLPNSVSEVRHEWEHPAFPRHTVNVCPPKHAEVGEFDSYESEDYFCCRGYYYE